MLFKGRIDFLLSYPSVSNYHLKQFKRMHEYVSLPIENIDQYITSHVGCTKNQWGKKVIADVERALLKAKPTPAYFNALTSWLNNKQVTEGFIQTYQLFIRDLVNG